MIKARATYISGDAIMIPCGHTHTVYIRPESVTFIAPDEVKLYDRINEEWNDEPEPVCVMGLVCGGIMKVMGEAEEWERVIYSQTSRDNGESRRIMDEVQERVMRMGAV